MASGDLTASTPVEASSAAEIKTQIDLLNLATVTDFIFVIPISGRDHQFYVFKVLRTA